MIQIYYLDTGPLKDRDLFRHYYEQMSEERRKKINFFRFDKDKRLSLGAGILTDRGLAAFGYREKEMQYGLTANRKPVFLNAPELHFNVSHSGCMVMAAFSDRCVLGCDIEEMAENEPEIFRPYFDRLEYAEILKEETEADRLDTFYRLWTAKESFMKATGLGMELVLNSFCVPLSPDGDSLAAQAVRHSVNEKQYWIREFHAAAGYKSSLCMEGAGRELPCRIIWHVF